MSKALREALEFVLAREGGYQCDRDDSGNWTGGRVGIGELHGTNFGISAASYPSIDIKALTREQAAAIYERDFWNAARCGELSESAAIAHFDCAVNMGIGGAARVLQRAVGTTEDGVIGPRTIAAARALPDRDLVQSMVLQRLRRYTQIAQVGSNLKFLPGWVLRTVFLAETLSKRS